MTTENKYSNWVFTLMEGGEYNILPSSQEVGIGLETISDEFQFQLETCPTTSAKHFQGCLKTRIRKRHSTLLMELAICIGVQENQITLDRMQGTWEQALEYTSKDDTRVGTRVFRSKKLVLQEEQRYKGKDLAVFEEQGFYPWQEEVNKIIFEDDSMDIKIASGREVIWIDDMEGNNGKSLYTKYLCYNNPNITKLAFGSGSQMRASIVDEGARACYIVDIPRKLCNDDFKNNIFSVIEDLKCGFVKSSMYGQSKTLFFEPPLVIIFSNFRCPIEQLSIDRWKIMGIVNKDLVDYKFNPFSSREDMDDNVR